MTPSDRETVELAGPFVLQTTTYSVSKRRAVTEDDSQVPSALVEHAGPPKVATAATATTTATATAPVSTGTGRIPRLPRARTADPTASAWRVELSHDRVWIRSDQQEIELRLEDAREVAQLLLRAVAK